MEKTAEKSDKKEERYLDGRGVIRIIATDIPSNSTIYSGLTRIKGISWTLSNAICNILGLEKARKMSTLTETEIEKITNFLKSPTLPSFLMNRRRDSASGNDKHLIKTDLDLQREFDIRDMKKIRSYKGLRHALGQPVRGQRTKSHFRKGRSIGVQRAKTKPATSPKGKEKKQ